MSALEGQPRVTKPTFFVNHRLVQQAIDGIKGKIGEFGLSPNKNSWELAYFTKVGPLEIADAVPEDMQLILSANVIKKFAQKHTKHKFGLYIGTPDPEDRQYGFINAADPKELNRIMMEELTDSEFDNMQRRVSTIIYDGSLPDDYQPEEADYIKRLGMYIRETSRFFPDARISLRIDATHYKPDAKTHERHGHNTGITLADIPAIQMRVPTRALGGDFNFYPGNPLTSEKLEHIAEVLHLPPFGSNRENLIPDPIPALNKDGTQAKAVDGADAILPTPLVIRIGGLGGFGEQIPWESIASFIFRANYHLDARVIIELGTHLVEQSTVLMFPEETREEDIIKALPDVGKGKNKALFIGKPIKGVGIPVMRPVSYAHAQLQDTETRVIEPI